MTRLPTCTHTTASVHLSAHCAPADGNFHKPLKPRFFLSPLSPPSPLPHLSSTPQPIHTTINSTTTTTTLRVQRGSKVAEKGRLRKSRRSQDAFAARERGGETERLRQRETETETETDTHRDRHAQRDRHRERQRQLRQTETDRERDREGDRERESS